MWRRVLRLVADSWPRQLGLHVHVEYNMHVGTCTCDMHVHMALTLVQDAQGGGGGVGREYCGQGLGWGGRGPGGRVMDDGLRSGARSNQRGREGKGRGLLGGGSGG